MSIRSDVPRRVLRDVDAPLDLRADIVEAASRCMIESGVERTSISAIAREAGVSRQTVYNHFSTKEEILGEAIQTAASEASDRIMAVAKGDPTAAGYAVETCIAAVEEFRRNPAIAPLITLLGQPDARRQVLRPDVIAFARRFLEPILAYVPERTLYLDEMTETFLRFELSLLTIENSPQRTTDELRDYLHRVLVPALGLT